ncbi:hypothetical protein ASC59_08520 [Leifsonia sp. Root1293]|nr:hypothetical protein ASC59_08520 [Leifsonia sp. Root1293]KRA12043.1 hypothetical protein ASD61_08520 [Leifsonia sp. Root60]
MFAFMAEYGWLWVLLAVINANIAASNRRSPIAWFLLSLAIGPFATVILLLRPAPPLETKSPAPLSGTTD